MVIFSQCIDCKNYIGRNEENNHICKAFPDGIGDDVFWNKIYHTSEIEGDNGYRFEEIKVIHE